MTLTLFFILVAVIFVWYVLMEIHGDTTFNWQMQKEVHAELQAIRKFLEADVENKRAANKAVSEMLYRTENK